MGRQTRGRSRLSARNFTLYSSLPVARLSARMWTGVSVLAGRAWLFAVGHTIVPIFAQILGRWRILVHRYVRTYTYLSAKLCTCGHNNVRTYVCTCWRWDRVWPDWFYEHLAWVLGYKRHIGYSPNSQVSPVWEYVAGRVRSLESIPLGTSSGSW